jgi:hypothetical protein
MDISNVTWRKASYSGGNGGACIEVGVWHKSSHSGGNGGDCCEVGGGHKASHSGANGGGCVEVASTAKAPIAVRDSKDPNGPKLVFAPSAWESFIQRMRSATRDLG